MDAEYDKPIAKPNVNGMTNTGIAARLYEAIEDMEFDDMMEVTRLMQTLIIHFKA